MHNPLTSEADAFRWVVVIGVGAVSVIALTLLTRPVFGVVLAAALIGFGAGIAYRGSRGSLPRSVALTRGGDGKHRLLVVANETVGGEALLEDIQPLQQSQLRDPGRDAGTGRVPRITLGIRHRRSDRAGAPADGAVADRDRRFGSKGQG